MPDAAPCSGPLRQALLVQTNRISSLQLGHHAGWHFDNLHIPIEVDQHGSTPFRSSFFTTAAVETFRVALGFCGVLFSPPVPLAGIYHGFLLASPLVEVLSTPPGLPADPVAWTEKQCFPQE
ncbi:hypothetical protein N7535_000520 [Penicillium sp. DV-2018c]|nr:hypothetical protein N7461_006234 [Penicillium sp. DV-2018c]KAJ5581900.1 hypothetical protein N7535_000520 [Penicillium sp. DV-2018c]